jgi:hypothetical protein
MRCRKQLWQKANPLLRVCTSYFRRIVARAADHNRDTGMIPRGNPAPAHTGEKEIGGKSGSKNRLLFAVSGSS